MELSMPGGIARSCVKTGHASAQKRTVPCAELATNQATIFTRPCQFSAFCSCALTRQTHVACADLIHERAASLYRTAD